MSTKLEAELAISTIVKHPKNPRHTAAADAEMVASIRENGLIQPIVVAPHPDKPATYIVIAGHRRLDGCKKAKRTTVPAIIREDLATEGQQIEAMIIENGHRVDLTPIEEAEGYAQLELLGYKATAIAAAVGRDVKTVRARMKLLKLAPSTRKKVHAGQMSLDDAAAFVEFADDPEATKKLERSASAGYDFRHTIQTLRRYRDTRRRIAADVAKLLGRGAEEIILKPGSSVYTMWDYDLGPCPVSRTFSPNWDHHKDCLGFVQYDSDYQGPMLDVVCRNPAGHKDQLDAAERERIAEREREAREQEAHDQAVTLAAELRESTAVRLVDGALMPPALRDLVRALLPDLLIAMSGEDLDTYQRLTGVIEPDRWTWISDPTRNSDTPNGRRLNDHLTDIDDWSDAKLTTAVAAVFIGAAESNLAHSWRRRNDLALEYLDFLAEAGHEPSSIDLNLRAELTGEEKAAS